ncbi:hypothetical protein ES705_41519 [subsurface metagenome]
MKKSIIIALVLVLLLLLSCAAPPGVSSGEYARVEAEPGKEQEETSTPTRATPEILLQHCQLPGAPPWSQTWGDPEGGGYVIIYRFAGKEETIALSDYSIYDLDVTDVGQFIFPCGRELTGDPIQYGINLFAEVLNERAKTENSRTVIPVGARATEPEVEPLSLGDEARLLHGEVVASSIGKNALEGWGVVFYKGQIGTLIYVLGWPGVPGVSRSQILEVAQEAQQRILTVGDFPYYSVRKVTLSVVIKVDNDLALSLSDVRSDLLDAAQVFAENTDVIGSEIDFYLGGYSTADIPNDMGALEHGLLNLIYPGGHSITLIYGTFGVDAIGASHPLLGRNVIVVDGTSDDRGNTIAHEIGHEAGLAHSIEAGNLMSASGAGTELNHHQGAIIESWLVDILDKW